MKIAFFETHEWENEILGDAFKQHTCRFFKNTIEDSDITALGEFTVVSVFIYSRIDKKVLDRLPKVQLIVTRSTGFDHIDVSECKKRGITVCNVPAYGSTTVAEHTFALLLALSRKIHHSYMRTTSDDFTIQGLEGFDLEGKTIGVIGTGRIGQNVIRIAKGFTMKVVAFDRYPLKRLERRLGFTYCTLPRLLNQSDIVTLHIPSSKENFHIINKKTLEQVKHGAFIINTARGDLIDTKALLQAVERDHIGGVGLDVLEGERLIKEEHQLLHVDNKELKKIVTDHALLHNHKVVFTPHIAFYSREALMRIINTTIETVLSYSKKKVINNV